MLTGLDVPPDFFFQELFWAYPWALSHHPPSSSRDWSGFLSKAIKAGIPAPVLVKVIENFKSPMMKKEKSVTKYQKGQLHAIVHNLGFLYSPSPSATPPPS